jgi:hypothetical protein
MRSRAIIVNFISQPPEPVLLAMLARASYPRSTLIHRAAGMSFVQSSRVMLREC